MQSFEVTRAANKKFIWIYPDENGDLTPCLGDLDPSAVAIQINYVGARQRELLTRKLVAAGIMRTRRGRNGIESSEVVPGRERERDLAWGKLFVGGWQNFTRAGELLPFSDEELVLLMEESVWFNRVLNQAVEELDRFFVSNGNGSSAH